jgi:hypothetical protein
MTFALFLCCCNSEPFHIQFTTRRNSKIKATMLAHIIPRGVALTTRGHDIRFLLPYSRIQSHQQSFFQSTIRLWNELPTAVVTVSTLEGFKDSLQTVMLLCIRHAGYLEKLRRVEGGAKIFGVFRVKNHDFTPKNHIFPNCGGRREHFWGISCEKSRSKNHIFSNLFLVSKSI